LDNGFEFYAIKHELSYAPSTDVEQIVNPLLAQTNSVEADPTISIVENKVDYYFPNAQKIPTELAELYTVDDFLSEEECEKLVELIQQELVPSTITNVNEADTTFRTSRTCALSTINHPFVKEIDRRLCEYLGINAVYAEGIQGQHYEIGQEFKAHTDYFEANELSIYGAEQGQRTWTFMLYLNDTQAGGETVFHKLNQSFTPKRGQGVIWNNLYPDGRPNPNTLHQSKPVQAGNKTIITKWFRAQGHGKQYTKSENEKVPALTPNYSQDSLD
jgi:prolyl 4-hydroxylase